MEVHDCDFCGEHIEPGTGALVIRPDGSQLRFCKSKCRKNMLKLKRVPRRVRWTKKWVGHR